MKKAVAGMMLAVFLTGCFPQEEQPAPPQDLRIVSIGDSLTQGVGSESGGYLPPLEERLESLETVNEAFFVNYGKRGNRTDQLLGRLEDQTVQADIRDADMIIITIGGNDVVQVMKNNWSHLTIENFQEEEENYEKRIEAIFTKVRSINESAGIVLVSIYNPFSRIFVETTDDEEIVRTWNKKAREVAEEFNQTAFVSIENIFSQGNDHLFYEDQFHPNEQGYEQIADQIFKALDGRSLEKLTNGKIAETSEGSN